VTYFLSYNKIFQDFIRDSPELCFKIKRTVSVKTTKRKFQSKNKSDANKNNTFERSVKFFSSNHTLLTKAITNMPPKKEIRSRKDTDATNAFILDCNEDGIKRRGNFEALTEVEQKLIAAHAMLNLRC